jgi:hypothetical protein
MDALVLAGDVRRYDALLQHVTSSAEPAFADDLLGMTCDVEWYLGEHELLADFELHGRQSDSTTAALIRATASWSTRAQGLGQRERASFLGSHGSQWLSYRHASAHVVLRTPDGHLHLHGVTQAGVDSYYVRLHLEVSRRLHMVGNA